MSLRGYGAYLLPQNIEVCFYIVQVSVEASVTDTEEDAWQTGPCLSLSVKAQDDSSTKGAPSQSRTQIPASFTQVPGTSRPPASSSGVTVEPYSASAHQMMQHPAAARPSL